MKIKIEQIQLKPAEISAGRQRTLTELGQLEPVVVYKNGDGKYHLIAGSRRVANLKAIGQTEVEAVVKDKPGKEGVLWQSLASNMSRSENPAHEAELVAELLKTVNEETGKPYTQQEIAQRLGVRQGVISKRKLLNKLIPELMMRLRLGEISATAAYKLARLPENLQKEALALDNITINDAQGMKTAYAADSLDLTGIDIPEVDQPRGAFLDSGKMADLARGKEVELNWMGQTLTIKRC